MKVITFTQVCFNCKILDFTTFKIDIEAKNTYQNYSRHYCDWQVVFLDH